MPEGWATQAATPLAADDAPRRMLGALYAARASLYELTRARLMQKAYYLLRLVPVLVVLVVGLAVLIGTIDGRSEYPDDLRAIADEREPAK